MLFISWLIKILNWSGKINEHFITLLGVLSLKMDTYLAFNNKSIQLLGSLIRIPISSPYLPTWDSEQVKKIKKCR